MNDFLSLKKKFRQNIQKDMLKLVKVCHHIPFGKVRNFFLSEISFSKNIGNETWKKNVKPLKIQF